MTVCSRDQILRANDETDERKRALMLAGASKRRWRRARGMTITSMAHMLGWSVDRLRKHELGKAKPRAASEATYQAFVQRWERVPEFQAKLAQEVHRTKMRYRAAALARMTDRERDWHGRYKPATD